MSTPIIAVSSMTNANAFLREGVGPAMEKLSQLGISHLEISQHIRFDEDTIPAFLEASRKWDIGICAISCRFDGTTENPVPEFLWQGQPLKIWSAERDFERLVQLCRQFDCKYLRFAGFPGMALRSAQQVRAYMHALETIATGFADCGIALCVHNHADEFMMADGRWLISWAMELAPHLQMELDVKNAFVCGVNPCDLLDRFFGRVPLLHVQDLQVYPSGDGKNAWLKPEYRGVPAGQGNINWETIAASAKNAGAKYLIIEQSQFYGQDPYACIAAAANTLRRCTGA